MAAPATEPAPAESTIMDDQPQRLLPHLDAFLGFARKQIRDPELAADAVQEALAKALAHQAQLRDDERLLPWFYRILRHTILDLQARSGRRRRRFDELPEELPAAGAAAGAACACLEPLLDSLPHGQGALLRAVDLGGEGSAAVAGRLGITQDNLKVRRHRARQALRRELVRTCRTCAEHGCVDCDCRPRRA